MRPEPHYALSIYYSDPCFFGGKLRLGVGGPIACPKLQIRSVRFQVAGSSGRILRVGETKPEKPGARSRVVLGLGLGLRATLSRDPDLSPVATGPLLPSSSRSGTSSPSSRAAEGRGLFLRSANQSTRTESPFTNWLESWPIAVAN